MPQLYFIKISEFFQPNVLILWNIKKHNSNSILFHSQSKLIIIVLIICESMLFYQVYMHLLKIEGYILWIHLVVH